MPDSSIKQLLSNYVQFIVAIELTDHALQLEVTPDYKNPDRHLSHELPFSDTSVSMLARLAPS